MNALIGYMIDGRNGGIDKYLLRVLSVAHEAGIHCDVLTNKANDSLTQALAPYEAKIFEVPTLWHPLHQSRAMKAILRKKPYDVAYFNISEPMNCIGVWTAHRCGVRRVVIHSHNTAVGDGSGILRVVKQLMNIPARVVILRWGDAYYACSEMAGQWLFGKRILRSPNFRVIYNPVDIPTFVYNPAVREQLRAEMSLEGKCVVGHIGNFVRAKNSFFLLDILEALLPAVPKAVLLSVGDGPEREAVMAAARERGLTEHVCFLGVRDDVPRLLQAMDVFVLPSLFEGLPVSAIEAQLASLKVLLSGAISREVKITETCEFLPIYKGGALWAERIVACRGYKRENVLQSGADVERFDLAKQKAEILGIFYEKTGTAKSRGKTRFIKGEEI